MIYLLLFLFSVAFVELFILLRLSRDIHSVVELSRKGVGVLMSPEMDDEEKELFIRRRALELFKATFLLLAKFFSVFLILYAFYFIVTQFSSETGEAVLAGFQSLTVLLILTVATVFYVWIRRSFAKNYSLIDRMLHHVAFSIPFVQKRLCELENDLFKRQINGVYSQREVFVTGLPRAGTTLILEMLYETDEFRTFTYRNMPFILTPLLWNRLSKPFRKSGTTMERAHGDGMEVSFDSPEAFEEIIWLSYMKDKIVTDNRLSPLLPGDETPEFVEAFRSVVKKLLIDESAEQSHPPRYLSKNNANFSRIELIYKLFPSSAIIIPFRQPLAHVSSLMKQHERFTGYHQEDRFSKRYMEWLGHYDFGENFKPINFDNWLEKGEFKSYSGENFWMRYWIAAYSYVLNHETENVYLVDFDKLLSNGKASLQTISNFLGLENKNKIVEAASRLRAPTSRPLESHQLSSEILRTALEIHEQLKSAAV